MLYQIKRQFRRRPFKGSIAYEWQIGPLVFMWYYFPSSWFKTRDQVQHRPSSLHPFHFGIGDFRVWYDSRWWN